MISSIIIIIYISSLHQIIDSISRDIAELRTSVSELDSASANRNSVLRDINNLRDNLGDKIQAARDAINGKVYACVYTCIHTYNWQSSAVRTYVDYVLLSYV